MAHVTTGLRRPARPDRTRRPWPWLLKSLALLICLSALPPFLLTTGINLETIARHLPSNTAIAAPSPDQESAPAAANASSFWRALGTEGAAPVPLPRQCRPGACLPRRYFSTTNEHPALYYLEPNQDPTGRHGMFADTPSRPWEEATLAPLDLRSDRAAEAVHRTMEWRYRALLASDLRGNSLLPVYLPPQFPQWDRSVHRSLVAPDATIVGLPPRCCPSNGHHRFVTQNQSAANVLSDEELNDCDCRAPRNYPAGFDRPIATLVTAFYQMSSKHPPQMYKKTAGQLLSTADPMIIFCEPNSTWIDFFVEQRRHAPTIVAPLAAEDLRLKRRFPQDTFWKRQYDIDPEGPTHHKGVNTDLYVIWDEKLVLLQSAAMLNPFNTTQFVWVDAGYWRNPAPQMFRQSAVKINITEEGVDKDATLLFQMINYNFNREAVISGDQVLVGGNSFAGTYAGISNLYSAFYDTFWAMSATGKFVGSDQKVLYRTCHTYPHACHIHKARKMRKWNNMLGKLLPGVRDEEKIGAPLELTELLAPEEHLPLPPNGIVDDATSEVIWKGVDKNA